MLKCLQHRPPNPSAHTTSISQLAKVNHSQPSQSAHFVLYSMLHGVHGWFPFTLTTPERDRFCYSLFPHDEYETYRSWVTCPRSHGMWLVPLLSLAARPPPMFIPRSGAGRPWKSTVHNPYTWQPYVRMWVRKYLLRAQGMTETFQTLCGLQRYCLKLRVLPALGFYGPCSVCLRTAQGDRCTTLHTQARWCRVWGRVGVGEVLGYVTAPLSLMA